jgi:small-conductance mechanosensitive channel
LFCIKEQRRKSEAGQKILNDLERQLRQVRESADDRIQQAEKQIRDLRESYQRELESANENRKSLEERLKVIENLYHQALERIRIIKSQKPKEIQQIPVRLCDLMFFNLSLKTCIYEIYSNSIFHILYLIDSSVNYIFTECDCFLCFGQWEKDRPKHSL